MLLNGKVGEIDGGGPRPLPGGISLVVHAGLLLLVAVPQGIQIPRPKTTYDQMIAGHEQKLVWYHFKEKLPEVRPVRSKSDDRPLRAETTIAKQSIVSSPKNAPKAPQMIWQAAPEINTEVKFDSANLVAVNLPKVTPPKAFTLPAAPQRTVPTPQPETLAPPDLNAPTAKPVELANARELPRPVRDFQPPPSRAKSNAPSIAVDAPPDLRAVANAQAIEVAKARELGRVARSFEPPASRIKPGLPEVRAVAPPPALAVSGSSGGAIAETKLGHVYRPFTNPPAASRGSGSPGKAGVSVPVLPSAPDVDAAGNVAADLNLVIVGLNPGNRLPALPPVSHPAEFSAGPKLNANGGAGAGPGTAAINVPDLTIVSGKVDTRPTIMARNSFARSIAPPNPADSLREAAKYITVDSIGRPSGTRVASAPDSRFDGRAVYMMAIQMPNITSYVGSWLMWYSERSARPVSTLTITPPVAHRKVDPKYIAAAVSERVEGTVRLAAVIHKDGTVDSVELVRGLDDRLDRTAQEALAKWQFTPALRNGEPIDVDVMVEIPFRLAPRATR